jgi:hypothetical protein
VTIKARASALHGPAVAMLRVLFMPLALVPVGCRTFEDDRYWYRHHHHGSYRPYSAPAPYVYQPAPPVFVVPHRPPPLPSSPVYVQPRPPERRFEHHHERPDHFGSGDRGHRLNRDSRPDHKRSR